MCRPSKPAQCEKKIDLLVVASSKCDLSDFGDTLDSLPSPLDAARGPSRYPCRTDNEPDRASISYGGPPASRMFSRLVSRGWLHIHMHRTVMKTFLLITVPGMRGCALPACVSRWCKAKERCRAPGETQGLMSMSLGRPSG